MAEVAEQGHVGKTPRPRVHPRARRPGGARLKDPCRRLQSDVDRIGGRPPIGAPRESTGGLPALHL
eukprot:8151994-Pyramimonas_sp.AAC.1